MSDFKNQSPWGSPPGGGNGDGFRRGPTPPDIDKIIRDFQEKIKYLEAFSFPNSLSTSRRVSFVL